MMKLVSAMIFLALSGSVLAACEQEDLSGKWKLFMANPSDYGICTLKFKASTGSFKGTCQSMGGKDSVKGKFKLDSNCAVTGYVDDGEIRGNIKGAQLSRDTQAMQGIIEVYGVGAMFGAVKV